ncbi:helix-turn-helix domain-containing protein [Eudoraea sp.]|uniref:helix-turn-helix domain-containing protein n=1 Tax=Eudoraea sp. TaxID=1979955 RepID=UPI003C77F426
MHQPELGKIILQLRKKLNLTQEELAEKSKLGLRTIQRIESGEVMPRNSTIDLLLKSLSENRQSLKNYELNNKSTQNRLANFFLIGDFTNNTLSSIVQTAWIAGIAYFLVLIIEYGFEYLIFNEDKVETVWKVFFILLKLWILLSFSLFMRGFTVLAKIFDNYLLRICSYLMIGLMTGIVFSDIIKVVLIENNELKVVFTFSKSIMAGVTSLFFGITLIRLQDSFGLLSKYAGIAEIVLGSCLISVFLSPLALILLAPATLMEIIILYKGYEFIKSELTTKP